MEFKDYLKRARKRNNMTQNQLAGLLECSQSAVSAWENGTCAPNIEQVRVLYRSLPLSLEDLFGEKKRRLRVCDKTSKQSVISLEQLRKGHNMSQTQLAELLNVSTKTIANWERDGIPHLSQIQAITKFFQVNINDLV